jgi:hypothetical protein
MGSSATASDADATAIGTSATANGISAFASGTGANAVGDGAVATGANSLARGTDAIAMGRNARADAAGAVAIGANAYAADPATAVGTNANASGIDSSAYGYNSTASGNNSAAFGVNSLAQGSGSTATGAFAQAIGSNSIAIGTGASAAATNSTAIGQGATVGSSFTGSTAIGTGASATRSNQIILGAQNTNTVYTLPGLAPYGSFINDTNQNGGEYRLTTVDSNGTLGTSTFSVQQLQGALESINNQIKNVGALAAAFSSIPNLTTGDQKYGCGIGTGVYGSGWAGSGGCVAKIGKNAWINGALAITGSESNAFGSQPAVAGRLGFFFQWGGPTTSEASKDSSMNLTGSTPVMSFGGGSDSKSPATAPVSAPAIDGSPVKQAVPARGAYPSRGNTSSKESAPGSSRTPVSGSSSSANPRPTIPMSEPAIVTPTR